MWFIHRVEITIGEAIDHVAEREEQEENQHAFPERLCFQRREFFIYARAWR
jgi:hypothetical protein